MDVRNTFFDRYLKVYANQVVSKHVTDNDDIIKKNELVEVSMDTTIDIDNMENIKLEDNYNLKRVHVNFDDLSDKMVEHVIHQMKSDFELSMLEDVSCLIDFQVKQMNDYTCDS